MPPLAEQRKIAAVLSLVQRAIEQQERLIALTKELKKAFMHKLFTEGLRGEPQKMTDIGPLPESWEVTELLMRSLVVSRVTLATHLFKRLFTDRHVDTHGLTPVALKTRSLTAPAPYLCRVFPGTRHTV